MVHSISFFGFFFQAEDGIRDHKVTGVQTCALPIYAAPLAPHIAGAVVARGGGNPLFLRHLAATARTARGTLDLPDTIETVVAARIDRLAPAAREVLRAAAVVGMSVDQEFLGELLDEQPARAASVLEYLGEFLSSDGGEL